MSDAAIRIFSYLPNPRVWKSLIAADLCGVEVEVIGDKPANLVNWLWDFDARELTSDDRTAENPDARQSRRGFSGTLYKTDAFLSAHPFGTVPAAFGPDGDIGIFESNSILRATVRASSNAHTLYGANPLEASRIDSFLDATLVFAREAQVYLLAINKLSNETYQRMAAAYEFFLSGIEQSLRSGPFIAGDQISIADIAFFCDTAQFLRERTYADALATQDLEHIGGAFAETYPLAYQHLMDLGKRPEFARHIGSMLSGL